MTEVEIGIYTHRWSELQVQAIESIAAHTKRHQYSIVVCQTPGNCHQNLNRLWSRFSAPYVVVIDEDVEVLQDGWLDGLLRALDADPELGLVSCNPLAQRPLSIAEPDRVRLTYMTWVPAHVMAFKRERVPFLQFDEAIPGQMGMTDVDACLQLRNNGLRVAVNTEVVVYHPVRDDDETRLREQRPSTGQQRRWFPAQVEYMRGKWGGLFESVMNG